MIDQIKKLSRTARRQAAKTLAPVLAKTFVSHGELIRHPLAVAALERGCHRMLLTGEPAVMKLSDREGRAFPGNAPPPALPFAPWLAVGLDYAGLGTYHIQWIAGDPIFCRQTIEIHMIEALNDEYTQQHRID